jgi:hypothetical protein
MGFMVVLACGLWLAGWQVFFVAVLFRDKFAGLVESWNIN